MRIRHVGGDGQRHYLRDRLFDPLGIGEVGWSTLAGREQGYSGLHARTEDIARLGQLYLQKGEWNAARGGDLPRDAAPHRHSMYAA